MSLIAPPNILKKKDGQYLAYHKLEGKTPGIVFLSGFRADMMGSKAVFFEEFCRERGLAYVRFDYSGHGVSSGKFEEGSISQWAEDALAILDNLTMDQQILVGSSMGGWIMTLVAMQRKARIAGLMGIASAPDFVESMIQERLTPEQRKDLETKGVCYLTSEGYDPYPLTQKMIEDGKRSTVLNAPIDLQCPMRFVHGMNDMDVPWKWSEKLMNNCLTTHATLTLVKGGQHSLSKDYELEVLANHLDGLLAQVDGK